MSSEKRESKEVGHLRNLRLLIPTGGKESWMIAMLGKRRGVDVLGLSSIWANKDGRNSLREPRGGREDQA